MRTIGMVSVSMLALAAASPALGQDANAPHPAAQSDPVGGPTQSNVDNVPVASDTIPDQDAIMSGGGGMYYEGIFYFPTQNIVVSGTGATTTPSPFTAYIGNTFTFTGTSTLTVGIDRTKTDIPVPAGLGSGTKGSTLVS